MTTIKYIATDADLNLIHGIGVTPEAAREDAITQAGPSGSEDRVFVVVSASPELIARVAEHGGGPDCRWHLVRWPSGERVTADPETVAAYLDDEPDRYHAVLDAD